MGKKRLFRFELRNTRFQKSELKEHASEFVLYSRYSGFTLEDFNEHLRLAKLTPVKSDFMESFRLELETTLDNARIINQLTKLYPSFGNWKIKSIGPVIDISGMPTPPAPQKKAKKSAPKKAAKPKKAVKKKAPAKRAGKPAKKKVATKKKPVNKKKK
ncbi:MAG: hypothetical protein HY280_11040 [Nitrospinae bacterium]|nr:hypothetical protein [Nitrospinota bacterium]